MTDADRTAFPVRSTLATEVDWWARSGDLRARLMAHAAAVVAAELDLLEFHCDRALAWTPADRWAHLQIVYVDVPLPTREFDYQRGTNELVLDGRRIPPAVACSWPDPVRDSRVNERNLRSLRRGERA